MVQIRSLCTSERGNETQSEKQNHRTRDQISSPVNEFDLLFVIRTDSKEPIATFYDVT